MWKHTNFHRLGALALTRRFIVFSVESRARRWFMYASLVATRDECWDNASIAGCRPIFCIRFCIRLAAVFRPQTVCQCTFEREKWVRLFDPSFCLRRWRRLWCCPACSGNGTEIFVHRGFLRVLTILRRRLDAFLETVLIRRLYVCGFSLGGALGTLYGYLRMKAGLGASGMNVLLLSSVVCRV